VPLAFLAAGMLEWPGMSKPATLLEGLCGHALLFGATSLAVECDGRREWVVMMKGGASIGIASYARSSANARELRENLYKARKKPLRMASGGKIWILKVRLYDSLGEDAFEVTMEPTPGLDASLPPAFTKKQGQYLAFIYNYTKIHRKAPAELDFERHFQVTPPSVHQMILNLELKGFIERTPGQPRSIRLLAPAEHLPRLE
jgi:LexA DNA binding domain-containing protein